MRYETHSIKTGLFFIRKCRCTLLSEDGLEWAQNSKAIVLALMFIRNSPQLHLLSLLLSTGTCQQSAAAQ